MKEEDFNLSIGNEPEADLDLEFGYVLDDDHLDEQPMEGTPLHSVMMANGILTLEDRERYYHYSPDNRGCCMEKPIIIEEKEDYVYLEYSILKYLLRPVPFRFVDYEIEKQRLICHDGKYLDALLVKVYTHPMYDMDENGSIHRQEPTSLGTEEYWFDISAGYKAMGERLNTRLDREDG